MNIDRATWIFLRGLARDARHWGDFLPAWQAAWPRARVQAIDLPGAGGDGSVSPLSIQAIAAKTYLRAGLALDRPAPAEHPVFVFANSLGGMVASEWLHAFPHCLAGGVLVGTSFGTLSPPWRRLRPPAWPLVLRAMMAGDELARERLIMRLVSNREDRAETWAPRFAAMAAERRSSLGHVVRQIVAASRYRAPRLVASPPTLVLVGERDRLVHPSCSQQVAAHFHSTLAMHPTSGHDVALDAPEWVIAQVSDWLSTRFATVT